MNREFIPVLMGNDINVYSMARAFYDEYRLKSYVFCKQISGPCQDSDILTLHPDPKIDIKEVFLEKVNEFARKNINKTILLIGCGDNYVEVISSNLDHLEKNIIAPYMSFDRIEPLTNKEVFYKICSENGIDHPETYVVEPDRSYQIDFEPPFVIKPADSVEYWRFPFEGQNKVFIVQSKDELDETIAKIFDAGYRKSLIIQEYIPGNDTNMRVLTCYSGKDGKVKMMALGHVLLEEHTPKGIGNHAVILNEYDPDLCNRFKKMLEKLNYIGFSNFDIKYDHRDGKYKAFELNPRQGRSNYYVTNSGYNLAKIIVEEYLKGKTFEETQIVDDQKLWMVVPQKVAFKYIALEKYKKEMKRLIQEKRSVNPLLYKKDTNIKRRLRIFKNLMSHYAKFKKYYGGNMYEH
ncbi:MAG: ATP-grasp domain-containing protein [Peptostreptococcaceae bacterium]|nr:ATP-grasp domain-containing protein [Peptostreptococcaceae bacterium]